MMFRWWSRSPYGLCYWGSSGVSCLCTTPFSMKTRLITSPSPVCSRSYGGCKVRPSQPPQNPLDSPPDNHDNPAYPCSGVLDVGVWLFTQREQLTKIWHDYGMFKSLGLGSGQYEDEQNNSSKEVFVSLSLSLSLSLCIYIYIYIYMFDFLCI